MTGMNSVAMDNGIVWLEQLYNIRQEVLEYTNQGPDIGWRYSGINDKLEELINLMCEAALRDGKRLAKEASEACKA